MNKRKHTILILLIVGVIVGMGLVSCNFFGDKNYKISIKRKVIGKCDSFKDIWNLGSVFVKEEEKEVQVGFELIVRNGRSRFDESNYAVTAEACKEITDYLFSDEFQFREEGYHLNFYFSDNQLFHLEVKDIGPEMNNIHLKLSDDCYFPQIRYSEWYPETVVLEKYRVDEEVLESLKYYTNLRVFKTGGNLTDEQRDQIMSICPNIEIEAGIY